jgi:hypothetical protein
MQTQADVILNTEKAGREILHRRVASLQVEPGLPVRMQHQVPRIRTTNLRVS